MEKKIFFHTKFLFLPVLFSLTAIQYPAWGQGHISEPLNALLSTIQNESAGQLLPSDEYIDKTTAYSYHYYSQWLLGREIHDAGLLVVMDGSQKILYQQNFLVPSSYSVRDPGRYEVTEWQAAEKVVRDLGLVVDVRRWDVHPQVDGSYSIYDKNNWDGPLEICGKWYRQPGDTLVLCHEIRCQPLRSVNSWNFLLRVSDGQIIEKQNHTLHCSSPFSSGSDIPDIPCPSPDRHSVTNTAEQLLEESSYRVFALPVESPLYGQRSLESNPSDPVFSPFGWHDTDGIEGAEFTELVGNNALIALDRDGNYQSEYNPDGGQVLSFDFAFDPNAEPTENRESAATNLFYTLNMTHDIAASYGFTEEAGNFQKTNYSGQGHDGDEVEAYFQFSAEDPDQYDPPAINNANFLTPADGQNGVLRLYVWDKSNRQLLHVLSPAQISGTMETGSAFFGPPVGPDAIEAPVVLVEDDSGISTDGCQSLINASELEGKIALIDRGFCRFGEKVLNVQQAGAIAAVICNNRPGGVQNMRDEIDGPLVHIPSVFISQSDCALLKAHIGSDLSVKLQRPNLPGPDTLDGAFDNGLIIHEYAHGISNRLTGGAGRVSCLNNVQYGDSREGEQMGEGWSDFLGMVWTHQGHQGEEISRGFVNYLNKQDESGQGERTFPYATDMAVNPVTYYDIYDASVPHGVGQVWASMLWDMYWAFIDLYGQDVSLPHGSAGNHKAIRLVIEGMRLQACDPGFVDGRDAILAADSLLFNGVHQCLIWDAFARRGLGFGAEQGLSSRRRDGRESYELPPNCIPTVKVIKTSTPLIDHGDTIDVILDLRNDTETDLADLLVTDKIPAHASPIESSLPSFASLQGDEVHFSPDPLKAGESMSIEYQLLSSNEHVSLLLQGDHMQEEQSAVNWILESATGAQGFLLSDLRSGEGDFAWYVAGEASNCDHRLQFAAPLSISGDAPMLRFLHQYQTEAGTDGGILEISTDNGLHWQDAADHFVRVPYNNRISLNTFVSPGQNAFSGQSDGWLESYVDLRSFKGMHILIRFRFACDYQFGDDGWLIDYVEVLDAFSYQSEVVVFASSQQVASSRNLEWGTIVQPDASVPTDNPSIQEDQLIIYPNPATDILSLEINAQNRSMDMVTMYTVEGLVIKSYILDKGNNSDRIIIAVSDLPGGIYIIEISRGPEKFRRKFIKL